MNKLEELQLADHNYLRAYFSKPWNRTASYYNPYSVYGFIADHLATDRIDYRQIKRLEDGTPMAPLGYQLYGLFAPASMESVYEAQKWLSSERDRLILYAPDFTTLSDNFEVYQYRPQVIYDCENLLMNFDASIKNSETGFLNKRERAYLMRNLQDLSFTKATERSEEHIKTLLSRWQHGPAGAKKKKLRMMKDYVVIPWSIVEVNDLAAFVGFRGDAPISFTCLAKLPAFPEMVSQVVSKSLNYKIVPGGYNNTSTWEIYQSCQWCIDQGIRYINASGTNFGTTHRHFKSRFCNPELDLDIYHWISKNYYK